VETIDRFSDELEIGDPIIGCVGGMGCGEGRGGGRVVLCHEPVRMGLVDRVMEFTRAMGWCLSVHYPDKILALERNKYTDIYANQTGATFTFVDNFYEIISGTQPTKLITIVDADMREDVYQQFLERWGTEANITKTNPEYVELNAKEYGLNNFPIWERGEISVAFQVHFLLPFRSKWGYTSLL